MGERTYPEVTAEEQTGLQRRRVSSRHRGFGYFVYTSVKERTPRAWRYAVRTKMLRPIQPAYVGRGVECPVCGYGSRKFFRNLCPHCGSGKRARLMALFLKRELDIEHKLARLLHFAPEPGLAKTLAGLPNLTYVPADLDPAPGYERVDATAIGLEPPFDGIISSHVLEHIPDDLAAMSEMSRVLSHDGWALVLVPTDHSLSETYEDHTVTSAWGRHKRFGQHDHVRRYGLDVTERLRSAGLTVHEYRYAEEIGADAERFGVGRDVIYLCRRA